MNAKTSWRATTRDGLIKGGAGPGPWLSEPKIELFDQMYARDIGAR
jgi:hypothetical protein